MSVLPVVTFLLFVIAAVGAGGSTKAEDAAAKAQAEAKLPKKPFTNLLTFKEGDYNEAFKSLDVNNDGVIKIDDLKSFYYHADSTFAIQKFMQLVDTPKSPGVIDLEEFTSFMNKEKVKWQAHEVKFLPSLESRQKYYADEILTYVYLVMDENAINNLFDAIESSNRKDGKLDNDEIKDMQVKFSKGNTQHLKLTDLEAKLVLREMGGGSETISKEDFKEYLLTGDLSLLFRECRIQLTSNGAEYNNGCLVRKLVRYTTKRLTEYMKTLVFDALDAKDKNQMASVQDIQEVFGCVEGKARHFISYINGGMNEELSYGELRPLLELPAIQTMMETDCNKEDLIERVFCFKWSLWTIINKNFAPKYSGVPDLDIIFLFEDLDTTNDGKIEPREDLWNGKRWNYNLAQKFMNEVAPNERNDGVNLDDFFSYVYQPYMMCAIGECQVVKGNKEKLACYNGEMEDMITHVLSNKEVDNFFRFYQHDIIYEVTLKRLGMSEPEIENYLNELGQGDHYVNPVEFMYFVKQQEPSHLFVTDEKVSPKEHNKPETLHKNLLRYLEHYMTEYDTIILFGKLDINNDLLIDKEDIMKLPDIDDGLLTSMAVFGNKEHVTLQEFWIFLNTKLPGSDAPRKRVLEDGCSQMGQEPQIQCFITKLKELK